MGFEAEAPESLGPGRETTNWPPCQLHPGPTCTGPASVRDSGFCLLRATPWLYPSTKDSPTWKIKLWGVLTEVPDRRAEEAMWELVPASHVSWNLSLASPRKSRISLRPCPSPTHLIPSVHLLKPLSYVTWVVLKPLPGARHS